jgi:hypothetical protein
MKTLEEVRASLEGRVPWIEQATETYDALDNLCAAVEGSEAAKAVRKHAKAYWWAVLCLHAKENKNER